MQIEKQRLAIAKVCPELWKSRGWSWSASGYLCNAEQMQTIDPLQDLNLMNEVLNFLYKHGINGMCGGQALSVYALELNRIIDRDYRGETIHRRLVAPANQCAEAFLSALNLWNDES